jgi:YcxB-like protein
MQIEVAMTYDEYFEGTRLFNLNSTMSRRLCFYLIWYGFPILAVLFALLTIFLWIGAQRFDTPVVVNFVVSVYFLWARFNYARRLRKLYERQAKNMVGRMTLTSTGLRFERKNGTANVDFTWSGIERWLERPEMFLAFSGPVSFVRIPKDKLSSAEQDEVRGWLSSAVKVS